MKKNAEKMETLFSFFSPRRFWFFEEFVLFKNIGTFFVRNNIPSDVFVLVTLALSLSSRLLFPEMFQDSFSLIFQCVRLRLPNQFFEISLFFWSFPVRASQILVVLSRIVFSLKNHVPGKLFFSTYFFITFVRILRKKKSCLIPPCRGPLTSYLDRFFFSTFVVRLSIDVSKILFPLFILPLFTLPLFSHVLFSETFSTAQSLEHLFDSDSEYLVPKTGLRSSKGI